MAKKLDMIWVNGTYIAQVLDQKHINRKEASFQMGHCETYLVNIIIRQKMSDVAAKLFCKMFEADYQLLTEKPKAAVKPEIDVAAVCQDLQKQVDEIKAQQEGMKKQNPIPAVPMNAPNAAGCISKTDDAITILKDITAKVGGCEEQDFRNKCNQYDISEESIQYAIKHLNCFITARGYGKNCKKWIMRQR